MLPETPKKPAEFFVKAKLHAINLPDWSRAVNVPTGVPVVAVLATVMLLMLMVMRFFLRVGNRPLKQSDRCITD